jgi:hypothetical protein
VITGIVLADADAAADFARVQHRQTWSQLARRLHLQPAHGSELLARQAPTRPHCCAGQRSRRFRAQAATTEPLRPGQIGPAARSGTVRTLRVRTFS